MMQTAFVQNILGWAGAPSAPADEAGLVARAARGDTQAFSVLVTRYTGPLYNLAHRLTGDSAEAENVTQETFMRALNSLPRSRLDLAFKPWLFRIAVNLCRDLARKKRPEAFADLAEAGQESPEEEYEDDAPLPFDQVEAHQLEQALEAAVEQLPGVYRAVITLRYTEDLSYDEIAAVLKISVNTVRTHLFRAKACLRQALADWE